MEIITRANTKMKLYKVPKNTSGAFSQEDGDKQRLKKCSLYSLVEPWNSLSLLEVSPSLAQMVKLIALKHN